jgi:hypothetical protein
MVWSILAAILLLALLALWLIRFRYHIEYESPAALRVAAGVHFLWWRKTLATDPLRLFKHADGSVPPDAGPSASGPASATAASAAAPPAAGTSDAGPGPAKDFPGQRGAVRLPSSWLGFFARFRDRTRQAGVKWMLDPGVWRLLAAFGWRSGRRFLWLIRPRIESLHVGLENAYDLARFASAWSVAQATVPALACPVTYGFGVREAELRARLGGRFTALGLLMLGLLSLTTFPFGPLLRRFARCWRDPELAGWQKRVLLP